MKRDTSPAGPLARFGFCVVLAALLSGWGINETQIQADNAVYGQGAFPELFRHVLDFGPSREMPQVGSAGDTTAFPGAAGDGWRARGGSVGDSVCHVWLLTDTDWTNPTEGELRFCTNQDSVIIVFDTAGRIASLDSLIDFENHTTLLGQTAQGGIAIGGNFCYTTWDIQNDTSVILSGFYSTQRFCIVGDTVQNQDNCSIVRRWKDIYVREVSCQGHADEAFGIATVSDTGSHYTLDRVLMGGSAEHRHLCLNLTYSPAASEYNYRASLIESACVYAGNRSPVAQADSLLIQNFVAYNWSNRGLQVGGIRDDDITVWGSYWKAGPATSSLGAGRVVRWDDQYGGADSMVGNVHLEKNAADTNTVAEAANSLVVDTTGSLWTLCRLKLSPQPACGADTVTMKASGDNVTAGIPAFARRTRMNAQQAYTELIVNMNVGAYRYMDCSGVWRERVEKFDSVLLQHAIDRTYVTGFGGEQYPDSIRDYLTQEGLSWPSTLSVIDSTCTDSEGLRGDGMPDRWEILNFGNTAQGPFGDPDGDDYINITEYAWGTDPNVFTEPDGSEAAGVTWFGGTDSAFIVSAKAITGVDTFVSPDGTDTIPRVNITQLVDTSKEWDAYYKANLESLLITSLDTFYGSLDSMATILTPAQVHTICTAWGSCDTTTMKARLNRGN